MKILFLKSNNKLVVELFIIYLLKFNLSDNVLLLNNVKFFIRTKNKFFFLSGTVVIVRSNFFSYYIYKSNLFFNTVIQVPF